MQEMLGLRYHNQTVFFGALTLMLAKASAQQPACPECLNIPPTYDPARGVSYVVISSGRTDGNCNGIPGDINYGAGWSRAENIALSRFGRHLTSIHDPIENAFIRNLVVGRLDVSRACWIGLQATSQCAFFWSDGTPFNYSNFDPNDIDLCGVECARPVAYGLMRTDATGTWNITVDWAQCCYATPLYGLVAIPCPDRVTAEPVGSCVRPAGTASLAASLSNDPLPYSRRITFQWRRDGQNLVDGPTAWGSTITGSRCANTPVTTCSLFIQNFQPQDSGSYDVTITTTCRPTFASQSALLVFDADGVIDQNDLDEVLFYFGTSVPAGASGDVDGNGHVDQDDLDLVLALFGDHC